jgi:hypothetical protein
MVVVFVVNRQFFEPLAGEFAPATGTDMREQAECPLAIPLLSNRQITAKLLKDPGLLFRIGCFTWFHRCLNKEVACNKDVRVSINSQLTGAATNVPSFYHRVRLVP